MNIINKENVTQLTKNGVRDLMENRKKKIIVQLIEIQKLNNKEGNNSDKFRVIVSDGDAKTKCILGNEAAKAADQYNLKEFCIVQLNDQLFNSRDKNPIIIITSIEIVNTNIDQEIGNPIDWQIYRSDGYQNPKGSNQIPVKYFKNSNASQNTDKSAGLITTQSTDNKTKSANLTQNQPSSHNLIQPNALSSQLSKGNNTGPFNSSNSRNGSQNQNSFGAIGMSRTSNTINNNNGIQDSNSGISYQRTATFGNQSSRSLSTGNSNNKLGSNVSPHKRLSELSIDDFTPIRALIGFSSDFTIKAKVIKKTDIRKYEKNGNQGQVFSIEIVDNDGGEIQGSFFGDAVQEYFPKIEEGRVYVFSGGTVKVANTRFQTVKNDYQIIFDKTTKIEEVGDDGTISAPSFKFVKLNQIEELDLNNSVDILVLVKDPGHFSDVNLKNGEVKPRRVLELYDSSLCTVELTLWGDIAIRCNPNKNDVVIGRALKISSFLNKKNLSFNGTSSQVFWGNTLLRIPEVEELINWRDTSNIDESEFIQISKTEERQARFCKTLDQVEEGGLSIQDSNEKKLNYVKVYVSHVKTDNNMYYFACSNDKCMKKLNGDENSGWKCFNCTKEFERPPVRYTLSIKIEDNTNCVWATAFGKEAETIFGVTADRVKELKDAGDDAKLADLVKEASCYEWKMCISTKQDYNNGEARTRFQVVKCLKMDYVKEIKNNFKLLELYSNGDIPNSL